VPVKRAGRASFGSGAALGINAVRATGAPQYATAYRMPRNTGNTGQQNSEKSVYNDFV